MLKVVDLKKAYDSHTQVFKGLNLEIRPGEFVSIFGPNGCGKSTLLNLIAGLEKFDSGQIIFEGRKKIAFIFQDYRLSLFPWLNTLDNIAYPLKVLSIPKDDRYREVRKICDEFTIKINLASYPYSLSGGQQQLIAILRALIIKPDIILMDEPFSSLDYQTTLFMVGKTQEIWQKTGVTVIFVSHDIDEAILLSQRLILLSSRPTMVTQDLKITLPYPRTSRVMGSPEFTKIKYEALNEFVKQVNPFI